MFERMAERVRERSTRRVAERIDEMTARVRAELPPGIAATAEPAGIVLSGRGLRRRFALEPALRWMRLR